MNEYLASHNEEVVEVKFEEDSTKYKNELMTAYQGMVDPFGIEIIGEKFDYEQNPGDPTHPTKEVTISPYEAIWD